MSKSFLKRENGVTLVVAIMVVIILVIISTMLALNAGDVLETDRLNRMYHEIESLENAILIYYSNDKQIPEKGQYTGTKNDFKNSDNYESSANYYIIDANKLNNINLKYGARKLCRSPYRRCICC